MIKIGKGAVSLAFCSPEWAEVVPAELPQNCIKVPVDIDGKHFVSGVEAVWVTSGGGTTVSHVWISTHKNGRLPSSRLSKAARKAVLDEIERTRKDQKTVLEACSAMRAVEKRRREKALKTKSKHFMRMAKDLLNLGASEDDVRRLVSEALVSTVQEQ
jgi:hypothetical protein